ncbi:MAG TPA: HD domain-containing phosphohydrolase [Nitrospira sp.]|jgi:putative two-component system response regulator|nr:HD domain-containing phosphohydrolase [Nitrospira sp.]
MAIPPLPDTLTQKPTVLVIDDEAGPRDALKVILRPFFNIQSAESAQAAIDVLNRQRIDLITLDQKLPDRQGLDLLQEIKQDHADIEVIIITGYGSLKSAMEGIRHGAAGYLLKPFNVTELITLVNQTLEKKQRLDYLRRYLHTSAGLWGSDAECAQAWREMRAGYEAIGKSAGQTLPWGDETADLLPMLSDLLEAKDRQLLNHCSRVSFYATLLANRTNLTVNEQKSLALGAFLHDIGKIGNEPYRFADDEIVAADGGHVLRAHPEIGAKLVAPLKLPAAAGQIIAYHHERWDGSGYPHGLRGDGIPILARIVCLAQAFDHLTAELPDRVALSIDDATRFLAEHGGTYFDPALTALFIQVVQECKASLPAMAIATNPSSRSDA